MDVHDPSSSKRRRLARDSVTSGTIAASQEVSESFLDRCTDPPEIKAFVRGQVRWSSWTAEDSTSNLAEHEEEVRQEVQRALGVALRKNNLGHCAVGVQVDMSRRIVWHVHKAARRLLQQDPCPGRVWSVVAHAQGRLLVLRHGRVFCFVDGLETFIFG